ncbi:MAG: nicotinamide riboside transporter PnuC [Gemmatimonadaceae bacterium]|jgi:nicotinamide mononucleotide transporter|nr:nicotinamide riboside transporter PnuC [Gemmatimonadaceae bacterium]
MSLGLSVSVVELAAAIATLVNVWLTIRTSLWSWAWGALAVALYAIVFWESHLWSSMVLQVAYYLPMQAVGWWTWLRAGPSGDDDLPVTQLGTTARLAWGAIAVVLTVALGLTMGRFGAAQTWSDAAITATSVVGQALMTRKVIEHWGCWVVVNLAYAAWLLPRQGLWLSAALYALLLVLAVRGWREWARALGRAHAGSAAPAPAAS